MQTQKQSYFDGETELEGLVCYPDGPNEQDRPLVIISHPWMGIDDFVEDLAAKIAGLGYVAFSLDIYGKGVRGKEHSDGRRLKQPFVDDPALLLKRLQLGYDQAVSLQGVDRAKVMAVGHCFGGMCVLELAKLDTTLRSVISIHGVLREADKSPNDYHCDKAVIINGDVDPLVATADLLELQEQLTCCGVDWTAINFGRGGHGFTIPKANGTVPGVAFDPVLDARTWGFMVETFKETLGS